MDQPQTPDQARTSRLKLHNELCAYFENVLDAELYPWCDIGQLEDYTEAGNDNCVTSSDDEQKWLEEEESTATYGGHFCANKGYELNRFIHVEIRRFVTALLQEYGPFSVRSELGHDKASLVKRLERMMRITEAVQDVGYA